MSPFPLFPLPFPSLTIIIVSILTSLRPLPSPFAVPSRSLAILERPLTCSPPHLPTCPDHTPPTTLRHGVQQRAQGSFSPSSTTTTSTSSRLNTHTRPTRIGGSFHLPSALQWPRRPFAAHTSLGSLAHRSASALLTRLAAAILLRFAFLRPQRFRRPAAHHPHHSRHRRRHHHLRRHAASASVSKRPASPATRLSVVAMVASLAPTVTSAAALAATRMPTARWSSPPRPLLERSWFIPWLDSSSLWRHPSPLGGTHPSLHYRRLGFEPKRQ